MAAGIIRRTDQDHNGQEKKMIARRRIVRLSITLLFVWFSSASAQESKTSQLLEGAKKEGKVKLGLTVRWEEAGKPAAKKIVETFESRYPFVKVDYERVGGSRERERVLTE